MNCWQVCTLRASAYAVLWCCKIKMWDEILLPTAVTFLSSISEFCQINSTYIHNNFAYKVFCSPLKVSIEWRMETWEARPLSLNSHGVFTEPKRRDELPFFYTLVAGRRTKIRTISKSLCRKRRTNTCQSLFFCDRVAKKKKKIRTFFFLIYALPRNT